MAYLKVLHGKTPAQTYQQLPVIADPGTDWTLIRDSADGVNSEPIPVHIQLDNANALRVRDSLDEVVFNVDTTTKEAIIRPVRTSTPSAIPTMVEGQISSNIEDGKLFLKGAGATVHEFSAAGEDITLASVEQSGVANFTPIVWNGSAWVGNSIMTLNPANGVEITADIDISGTIYSGDPTLSLNKGGAEAAVNGAGLIIQYNDGAEQTHIQLIYDPTTYEDAGWALYHAKSGVEAMSELLTQDSVINGGTY
jgi:hypothetical protein